MNYTNDNAALDERLVGNMRVLLEHAGAIKECRRHDGEFVSQDDEQAVQNARDAAFRGRRRGDEKGASYEQMNIAIDEAMADATDQCPICEANRRRRG